MGLDTVELVMEVEDAFGVSIPNDSAATIRTVGDLHRVVLALHRQGPCDPMTRCPSAMAFYKTRSALITALGVERRSIRPETALDDPFPKAVRVKRHKTWAQAMKPWRAPHLRLPAWLDANAPVLSLGFGFLIALIYFLTGHSGLSRGLAACLIGIGACFAILILLAACFRRHWPPACRTVGDLSHAVLLANPGLAAPGPAMTDDFAWRALVPIVSAQLGVPEAQIHPHSRFVEDLRAD